MRTLPIGPIGHLKVLDGLRGVAILAVLAVHLYSPLFGGGNWGVDLFFVLSGFLITKLAFEEHDRNSGMNLRGFYSRRVVRLQPALFVVLAVSVVASFTIYAADGRYIRNQALLTALISGNLYPFFFGDDPRPMLGQTWSLAIEEQFYLVWPMLLVLPIAAAFTRPRRFLWVVGCATVASVLVGRVVVGAMLDYTHWASIPVFNIDGLAIGCMMAVYLHTAHGLAPRWNPVLLWTAIVLIGINLFVGGRLLEIDPLDWQRPVIRLLVAYIVLMAVLYPRRWPITWMELGVLLYFGRISYSLYLWHVPVFYAFDEWTWSEQHRVAGFVLKITVAILLAQASYSWIERPLIDRYRQWTGHPARRLEPRAET